MEQIKLDNNTTNIVGRLAPSPTGALHLGNARSFLLAWLSIRSRNGRLIVRMEDLDHPKVKPWATKAALDDLHWLGLDWDAGPDTDEKEYIQSNRKTIYREYLQRLIDQNLVYPCICSRNEIENIQSAPHRDDQRLIYNGTCRNRFNNWDAAKATLGEGRLPAWRFRLEKEGTISFQDLFCGECIADYQSDIGDFALARDESGAGYTFAHVVDDYLMGVTEVLRGDDLLEATHSHIILQQALELPTPQYIHVPLVVAEDGRRLAKRHGDTRIAMLREKGFSAKQVVGILAWWWGWADFGEELNPEDLLSRFCWDNFNREPAILTPRVKEFFNL